MSKNNSDDLTSKNLDQLSDFLHREVENPTHTSQIPDGAHIFHGSHKDTTLTQDNLKLASSILLGMTLGYVEDSPLILLFEDKHGQHTLLDLSETLEKEQAQAFIGQFQKQSQKKTTAKINQLLAA